MPSTPENHGTQITSVVLGLGQNAILSQDNKITMEGTDIGGPRKDQQPARWKTPDLLVLIAAKRFEAEKSPSEKARDKMMSAERRWKEVEDFCRRGGVNRKAGQCRKRWERLMTDFKKIYDSQKQIPPGNRGYFEMSSEERKRKNLPLNFMHEWYEGMVAWVPNYRALHPDQNLDGTAEEITPILAIQHVSQIASQVRVNLDQEEVTGAGTGSPAANGSPADGRPAGDGRMICDGVLAGDVRLAGDGRPAGDGRLPIDTKLGGDGRTGGAGKPPVGRVAGGAKPVGDTRTDIGAHDDGSSRGEQGPSSDPNCTTNDTTPSVSEQRGWKRRRHDKSEDQFVKLTAQLLEALAAESLKRNLHEEKFLSLERQKHTEQLAQAVMIASEVSGALKEVSASLRFFATEIAKKM